jgi:hypothetical protein
MNHSVRLQLVLVRFAILLFCCSLTPSYAAGLGWSYWSLSWSEVNKYFGHGTKSEKTAYVSHLKKTIAHADDLEIDVKTVREENYSLWKSWIEVGLDYSSLSSQESLIADAVLRTLIGSDAQLESLKVQLENDPDFLGRKALEKLLLFNQPRLSEILSWFRFGRSLGQRSSRKTCYVSGAPWSCYNAYVLLSPRECMELGTGISTVFDNRNLTEEDRVDLKGFSRALIQASKNERAVYVLLTD